MFSQKNKLNSETNTEDGLEMKTFHNKKNESHEDKPNKSNIKSAKSAKKRKSVTFAETASISGEKNDSDEKAQEAMEVEDYGSDYDENESEYLKNKKFVNYTATFFQITQMLMMIFCTIRIWIMRMPFGLKIRGEKGVICPPYQKKKKKLLIVMLSWTAHLVYQLCVWIAKGQFQNSLSIYEHNFCYTSPDTRYTKINIERCLS